MSINQAESLLFQKIPIGYIADTIVFWLRLHAGWFFNSIRIFLDWLLQSTLNILLLPSPYIVILCFCVLSWILHRDWKNLLLTAFGFLFVINQGYWEPTMQTLALLFWSCIICMSIGIFIGIACAHRPYLYSWVQPVLNLMQTLPTFVYLIPAIIFFRIGMVPGLIATIIFVLPTSIRLTQMGIASTPSQLLEAGRAFGANTRQILWKIELPHAMPQIRESLTQTIMLSLSMVVIAASVGGDGLGVPVYRALQQYDAALGFEAGCVIVVVAIILDQLFRPKKGKTS